MTLFRTFWTLIWEGLQILGSSSWSRTRLVAENHFLRKQLALYQERNIKPRRADRATKLVMVWLSKIINWQDALVIVTPATFLRWHRQGFKYYWRWKSRGRPAIPQAIIKMIQAMAQDNPNWSPERIANELPLKLTIVLSPETVRKYMPKTPDGKDRKHVSNQRWQAFLQNHLHQSLACDFFVTVSINFQILCVFVILELDTRKILHTHVTQNPTAEWTQQQFRQAIPSDHDYRFIIHDRDAIFSPQVDRTLANMGLHVLKTPVRTPTANAYAERVIGTIRRECTDFLLVLSELHLFRCLQQWVKHYNQARPHMSLGPGIPEPLPRKEHPPPTHRHCIPAGYAVVKRPVLGGLHHEYELKKAA